MQLISINENNREYVNKFLIEHWFSTDMVVRGKIIDMTKVNGIIATENNSIVGLATYEIKGNECELLSLDSLTKQHGIGTTLLDKVISIAKENTYEKLKLVTTNDNINAICFYQKRGFDMTKLYYNSLNKSRELKPQIPLIGDNNIPLRNEIEFELKFADSEAIKMEINNEEEL